MVDYSGSMRVRRLPFRLFSHLASRLQRSVAVPYIIAGAAPHVMADMPPAVSGDREGRQHVSQAAAANRDSELTKTVKPLPCAMQELAGIAEADTPRAGMFLWLKLLTVPDSGALRAEFKQEKVVVVPGVLPSAHLIDDAARHAVAAAPSDVRWCSDVWLIFSGHRPTHRPSSPCVGLRNKCMTTGRHHSLLVHGRAYQPRARRRPLVPVSVPALRVVRGEGGGPRGGHAPRRPRRAQAPRRRWR